MTQAWNNKTYPMTWGREQCIFVLRGIMMEFDQATLREIDAWYHDLYDISTSDYAERRDWYFRKLLAAVEVQAPVGYHFTADPDDFSGSRYGFFPRAPVPVFSAAEQSQLEALKTRVATHGGPAALSTLSDWDYARMRFTRYLIETGRLDG